MSAEQPVDAPLPPATVPTPRIVWIEESDLQRMKAGESIDGLQEYDICRVYGDYYIYPSGIKMEEAKNIWETIPCFPLWYTRRFKDCGVEWINNLNLQYIAFELAATDRIITESFDLDFAVDRVVYLKVGSHPGVVYLFSGLRYTMVSMPDATRKIDVVIKRDVE